MSINCLNSENICDYRVKNLFLNCVIMHTISIDKRLKAQWIKSVYSICRILNFEQIHIFSKIL